MQSVKGNDRLSIKKQKIWIFAVALLSRRLSKVNDLWACNNITLKISHELKIMHAQPSPYILASSSRTRSGIWTLTISVHISPVPSAVTPIFIYCAQLNNNNFAFFLLFSLLLQAVGYFILQKRKSIKKWTFTETSRCRWFKGDFNAIETSCSHVLMFYGFLKRRKRKMSLRSCVHWVWWEVLVYFAAALAFLTGI